MRKLPDGQWTALSRAAQRDDGAVDLAESWKEVAATRIAKALIARKLVREVKAKSGMPAWRRDRQGRSFSLVISNAGRKAIGFVDDDVKSAACSRDKTPSSRRAAPVARSPASASGRKRPAAQNREQSRSRRASSAPSAHNGAKKALLIEMLSSPVGTSLAALSAAIGWLPHSTRAALTGLRRAGYCIERFKREDGVSVYRLPAWMRREERISLPLHRLIGHDRHVRSF